jgi:hypothetical protein
MGGVRRRNVLAPDSRAWEGPSGKQVFTGAEQDWRDSNHFVDQARQQVLPDDGNTAGAARRAVRGLERAFSATWVPSVTK